MMRIGFPSSAQRAVDLHFPTKKAIQREAGNPASVVWPVQWLMYLPWSEPCCLFPEYGLSQLRAADGLWVVGVPIPP